MKSSPYNEIAIVILFLKILIMNWKFEEMLVKIYFLNNNNDDVMQFKIDFTSNVIIAHDADSFVKLNFN